MGVKTRPGIFQSIMYELLVDIPNIQVYLDDILITSNGTFEEHAAIVETVLERLQKPNFRANLKNVTILFSGFFIKLTSFTSLTVGLYVLSQPWPRHSVSDYCFGARSARRTEVLMISVDDRIYNHCQYKYFTSQCQHCSTFYFS
jgi:hypothetical protein